MEYRGYYSVGMATLNSGKLLIKKGVGKVAEVNNSLGLMDMAGQMGIGHRRWATHGGVNDSNAHPHFACTTSLAIVNVTGISTDRIELSEAIRKTLELEPKIALIAGEIKDTKDIYLMGRSKHFSIS